MTSPIDVLEGTWQRLRQRQLDSDPQSLEYRQLGIAMDHIREAQFHVLRWVGGRS